MLHLTPRSNLRQVLILDLRKAHQPHFEKNKNFPKKENDQLYQLLNNSQKYIFRKI